MRPWKHARRPNHAEAYYPSCGVRPDDPETRTSAYTIPCFSDFSSCWHARIASLLAGLGFFLLLVCNRVAAYPTNPDMNPTNLTIRLVLNMASLHDNFTRYLTSLNL